VSSKIKSSIELAMEKMAKLPKLTEEELRERQESEYGPRGRAIAARFLAGDLEATRLGAELSSYKDERGEIVRKALLVSLCQSIDLEDAHATAKALEGIHELVHCDSVEETSNRLGDILRDYEQQRQRQLETTQGAEDPRLRDLGISGSAIRLNPDHNEAWCRARTELQQRFLPKVDQIKRELTGYLLGSCADG
jgi:hypothetical protein